MVEAVADELGDILGLVEEGEALEGADADMAVAEPGQHRRAGGRGLVAAPSSLAGLEQGEGLRRVDAQRLEHLGRQHLADAALQGQPAVAAAAVGRLAAALGAEVEQAVLDRRAAGRRGSRGRRRCPDCTRGTGGRGSEAPAARSGCRAAARTGRNGAPSLVAQVAQADPLRPAAVEEARRALREIAGSTAS